MYYQSPEQKLAAILKEIRYGELKIKYKDGKPVMASVCQDIKLD
jgi:hypothetical protein